MEKRKQTKNLNKGKSSIVILYIAFIALAFVISGLTIYSNKENILYYLSFKSYKISESKNKAINKHIDSVLLLNKEKIVGFDVSEYQNTIKWNKITTIRNNYPLQFVFIRATAGKDKVDTKFVQNWQQAEKYHFIKGAYHYYRPNENSLLQAENFIQTVTLKKGDLPPVLDIEQLPKNQSINNLKIGLKRWLLKVENKFKMKPIIYTGEHYYNNFLKDDFKEYPIWIANYNFSKKKPKQDWLFWQFTEKATIKGISTKVDVNIFNGSFAHLVLLTKQNNHLKFTFSN